MSKSGNNIENVANKLTNWYNIIIFIVFIGSAIGNYMLSNYKLEQHDIRIDKLDSRISKTEGINYELLLTQLDDIKNANKKLENNLNETNGRIDKVLEILSNK